MAESTPTALGAPPVAPASSSTTIRAAELLDAGGIVAFPTETVYGLGARVDRHDALARVFAVKGRPHADPLIVHVDDVSEARRLTAEWPAAADELAARWWPGPLTIVVRRLDGLDDLVCAGGDSVGIRVPAHPAARDLLRAAGAPVAAPSANRFGRISPTTASHVVDEFADRAPADRPDLVVDGGACPLGVESTVVDLTGDTPTVLRPGGLAVEDLRGVLGEVTVAERVHDGRVADGSGHQSPGGYLRHYAPGTPLVVLDGPPGTATRVVTELSARGVTAAAIAPDGADPGAFAASLYASLRAADGGSASLLVAELVDPAGLGRAVNDRLFRAAHGRLAPAGGGDAAALVDRVLELTAAHRP